MNADNRVKEVQHTFQADAPAVPLKRYRAKVFKSGNSLALRLPAELGLQAGVEMELEVGSDGVHTFWPAAQPKRKIDVSGFAGKAPWLKPLPPELREFEERPSTVAVRKRLEEGRSKA
jgi:antitoxin VapB